MPGTAPDFTVPPVVGEAQAVPKPPLDPLPPSTVAGALAARRESSTISSVDRDAFRESVRNALQGVGEDSAAVTTAPSPPLTALAEKKLDKPEEAQMIKQFIDDDGHFSMARNFRLADMITIMNGVCGSMSVFSSANYLLTSDRRHLWAALWFPLFGLLFDFMDGKVARWRKETSMLGQELDSLADSLSFGLAPALLGYVLGLRTPLDLLILCLFNCCGIARLARFNATVALIPKDATGKSKYFEGVPIPTTLILVGLMALCVLRGTVEPLHKDVGAVLGGRGHEELGLPWGTVGKGIWEVHYCAGVFAAWGAAMVSKTLRVPKL